jgi:hypothetical protein
MKAIRLKTLSAAVVAAFALVSATAQAQLIRAQDDDIEFVLTSTLQPKTSGLLAEGDIIVSVFEFPDYTIGGVDAIPAGQEITGLAVIQIADITGNTITFQPYTGGFNAISPVDVTGGNAGEGAMIAVFQNDTATFDLSLSFATDPVTNCTDLAQCAAEGTAGTLLQVDGFSFADADESWVATLIFGDALDIGAVAAASGTTLIAGYNAALTTFFNSSGPIGGMVVGGDTACDPALLGCIAGPTVSGTVTGGGGLGAEGAFARSDIDAQKLIQQVPEPGTLALAGLGLFALGAGALRRRRVS